MAILEPVTVNDRRRSFRIASPATLEPLGQFDVTTAEEVREMVARARRAQPAWAALSFRERGRYVKRALAILLRREDDFVRVIRGETGRSRYETLMMEMFPVCDALQYYSRRAAKLLRDQKIRMHAMPMKKLVIHHRPLGVVGIITPWNGPFVLSTVPAVQALMAGNAVVLKPSEVTPFSGRLAAELLREAGLPPDLFQVALGDGETGAALIESEVDKISFTGSVRTGRKVGESCGRRLIPCTLELGGKDAMIVCADADVDRAANGAVASSLLNNGQVCVSTERVYAVEPIADELIDKIVRKVKTLRQGVEGDYDLGPAIWAPQLELIERHVEDARAKGAKILTGGRRNRELPGLFYEPTVMTDVTHEMAIMTEETFGPIIPIMRCRDERQALRLANDCAYGLSGTIWTRNEERGRELARHMETGSICINDGCITYGVAEAPFGGTKQSGVGYVHGPSGLRSYCRPVPIIRNRWAVKADEFNWYPYTEAKARTMARAMRFIWGTPLRWLLS